MKHWKKEVQPGEVLVTYGHVTEGYEYPMLKFVVIAESDIFGRKKEKAARKNIVMKDRKFGILQN